MRDRKQYWLDYNNKRRFGSLREQVLKRDGHCCVHCGMTNEEHIIKYKKSLTIDHKNGIGRKSPVPDNRLENLQTLCLPCHGSKDGKRGILKSVVA